MTIWGKINNGAYNNNLEWVHPLDNSKGHAAWIAKEKEVNDLFYDDACRYLGLNPNSKRAEIIFEKAYTDGHGFGYSDVLSYAVDLTDIVNKIEKAESWE